MRFMFSAIRMVGLGSANGYFHLGSRPFLKLLLYVRTSRPQTFALGL